nr:immunoglobulin heavy chain junction region [Macaca mulatta]MOX92515.1 immunoglobulin heavy chain junction region [Macaca mulatta]MOX92635.1 immunoglobulin heavy chain junction region [Macaca mulatta]MOX96392.1 immunoglobulin heavy chain junction region [Macaca mulatta]
CARSCTGALCYAIGGLDYW